MSNIPVKVRAQARGTRAQVEGIRAFFSFNTRSNKIVIVCFPIIYSAEKFSIFNSQEKYSPRYVTLVYVRYALARIQNFCCEHHKLILSLRSFVINQHIQRQLVQTQTRWQQNYFEHISSYQSCLKFRFIFFIFIFYVCEKTILFQ